MPICQCEWQQKLGENQGLNFSLQLHTIIEHFRSSLLLNILTAKQIPFEECKYCMWSAGAVFHVFDVWE